MAESFDPYRVWLGIPPQEQPPNYYRLLGVGLFESDPDVIASAADRQMAHVRTFQNGPRAKLSQEILNELSAANVCLQVAEKRGRYEKLLRSELDAKAKLPAQPPLAQPPQLGVPAESLPMVAAAARRKPAAQRSSGARSGGVAVVASSSRRSTSRSGARKKSSNTQMVVILASGGLVLLLLIAFALNSGGGNPDKGKPDKIANSGRQKSPSGASHSKPRSATPRKRPPQNTTRKTSPLPKPLEEQPVDFKPPVVPQPKVDPKPIDPKPADKQIQPPAPVQQKIEWTRFPFSVVANEKAKRPEKPAPAFFVTARSRVKKIYKNEFLRARKRGEKDDLAGKLIAQAKDADDPALRYVLLQEAHDLAIAVPNGERLMAVIDRMAEVYDVDVLRMKSAALSKATLKTNDRAVLGILAGHAKAVSRQAESARRFDVAASAARAARTIARKARNREAGRSLEQRVRELETIEKSYKTAAKAAIALVKNPQDPAASLIMGRYLIGVEGDWQRGLPTLAAGGKAEPAKLARADLSNPPGPDEQSSLGDRWYALAKRTGTSKSPNAFLLQRARDWYARAVDKLQDIEKVKIQQRIEEIEAIM
ncbi:MAG: hypothetical protein IID44_11350 [Planctomycetes bacterium]|nr:hypothetical protein [Planctomycetota bacterium]